MVRMPRGSRPVSGSSSSSARGLCRQAQPTAVFCRMPRDNSDARAMRFSVNSRRISSYSASSCQSRSR